MLNTKKIFPFKAAWYLGVGVGLVWIIFGCNMRIEGCLDVQARNYDLQAERPCPKCCEYPVMALALSQRWNERNYSNADTLFDMHGQSYKITDLKYFLSSWSWTDPEGHHYTVDSTEADCQGMALAYTPDILIIDSRQFAYTMGTFRQSPFIESIDMIMGLAEDFSCLDPGDPATPSMLTEESPLWNPQTQTLENMRIIIQKNLDVEILDTLFISLNRPFQVAYELQLEKGMNTPLMLTVNYAHWFQNVELNELSSFETSLFENIDGSFQRTP